MGMENDSVSIEERNLADLVMLDLGKPHTRLAAGVDLASRTVYSTHSSGVRCVFRLLTVWLWNASIMAHIEGS